MSILVNGTDLATLGFVYARRAGDLTPAVGRPPSTPAPGQFGERLTGADATLAPRRITVPGTLVASAPGAFVGPLRALARLCAGNADGPTANAVALSFSDSSGVAPTVQYTAYLADATVFDRFDPQELARYGPLTLVFDCPDPLAYDVTQTVLATSTTANQAAMGTAAAYPIVVLDGGTWTTRTVTLVDGAGATVRSLTVTKPSGTAGTGQYVEINMADETVIHDTGAGTRTPHAAWLTAGDFFAFLPSLAVAGVDCGLRLSAGTGTTYYRRAYR